MPAGKKGEVVRIRPLEGDSTIANQIAEATGLSVIDVMSLAMSAGLKAIKANGYKLTLPLEFEIIEGTVEKFPERRNQAVVIEDAALPGPSPSPRKKFPVDKPERQ